MQDAHKSITDVSNTKRDTVRVPNYGGGSLASTDILPLSLGDIYEQVSLLNRSWISFRE